MATRKELEAALRAAHEAGNVEDATRLADALAGFKKTVDVEAIRSAFDGMPWYMKPVQAADDIVRIIANGMTLGLADKIVGKMTGEDEEFKTEEARARAGSAGTVAEIIGMLAPASATSKIVGAAIGLTRKTVGESALREAIAGGILGGSQAAIEDDDILTGGILGMAGGAVGGAVGAKAGDVVNWVGKKLGLNVGTFVDDVVPPKTVDQLRAATNAAYDKVDDLGTVYDPTDFAAMLRRMDTELGQARLDPRFHPRAFEVARDLRGATGQGPLTPRSIDNLRRIINRDVSGNEGEAQMASIMRRHLDDFIENGIVTTGNGAASSAEASQALRAARDINRRMRTLEDIDEALYKGENASSPRGDINALRTLLNNPKKRRGMSPEEIEALERVVRGDKFENFLRKGIGGIPITPLGAGIVVGGATANPMAGVLAGGGLAVAQPLVERAARSYTDDSILALKNAIAGGKKTPAKVREFLTPLGDAAALEAIEEDRKKLRERRR